MRSATASRGVSSAQRRRAAKQSVDPRRAREHASAAERHERCAVSLRDLLGGLYALVVSHCAIFRRCSDVLRRKRGLAGASLCSVTVSVVARMGTDRASLFASEARAGADPENERRPRAGRGQAGAAERGLRAGGGYAESEVFTSSNRKRESRPEFRQVSTRPSGSEPPARAERSGFVMFGRQNRARRLEELEPIGQNRIVARCDRATQTRPASNGLAELRSGDDARAREELADCGRARTQLVIARSMAAHLRTERRRSVSEVLWATPEGLGAVLAQDYRRARVRAM